MISAAQARKLSRLSKEKAEQDTISAYIEREAKRVPGKGYCIYPKPISETAQKALTKKQFVVIPRSEKSFLIVWDCSIQKIKVLL